MEYYAANFFICISSLTLGNCITADEKHLLLSREKSVTQCFKCFHSTCLSDSFGNSEHCEPNISNHLPHFEDNIDTTTVKCPPDAHWKNDDPVFIEKCLQPGSLCGNVVFKVTVYKHHHKNSTATNVSWSNVPYPILHPPSTSSSEYNFLYTIHTCSSPKLQSTFPSLGTDYSKPFNKTVGVDVLEYKFTLMQEKCTFCDNDLCNKNITGQQVGELIPGHSTTEISGATFTRINFSTIFIIIYCFAFALVSVPCITFITSI